MAKSMVEKYEQILSADPGSMVFVELAKALLDRGDSKRAIDVCKDGLQHHPESVVGRVLWGKALINCGKPVEAMEQFDQAISIDRENPYAYNLIGEVLLHKGLHRSALPILKKAVALQPNDTRVRQWLEQTTRALNGDKPEVKPVFTTVDAPPPGEATVPGRPSLAAMGEPTLTDAKAYVPGSDAPAASPAPAPAKAVGSDSGESPILQGDEHAPELVRGMTDIFQSLSAREEAAKAQAPAPAPTPIETPVVAEPKLPAEPPARRNSGEIARPAPAPTPLETQAAREPEPTREAPPAPVADERASQPTTDLPPEGLDPAAALARQFEETQGLAPDKTNPGPPPPSPKASGGLLGGLLGDLPGLDAEPPPAPPQPALDADTEPPDLGHPPGRSSAETLPLPSDASARDPEATREPPPPAAPPPVPAGGPPPLQHRPKPPTPASEAALRGGPPPLQHKPKPAASNVLADLPDPSLPTPTPTFKPKVELSNSAAEAIAKEYERELREKLAAAEAKPKPFLVRNALKIGASVLVVLLGVVAVGVYKYQKKANTNVPESLARARTGLEKDTASSYQAALAEVADVIAAKPDEAQAYALSAYAHAVLFREHGEKPADRAEAEKALGHPGAAEAAPDLAAAARYYLADTEADRTTAAKAMMAQPSGGAEVTEIVGKILLPTDPAKGVEQLNKSLKQQSSHVRSYVALGDYFLDKGDAAQAYPLFASAKNISEKHPEVLLGLAQARLALNRELEEASADLGAVEKDTGLTEELKGRLDLAMGRLLAIQGKVPEAISRLTAGQGRDPARAVEFHQALAEAYAQKGEGERAFNELAAALKERPKDPALVEASARAALGMGRPQDALRLSEGVDDRKVHLVRGIARFDLGEYEAAKKELLATKREKGMPTEAAIMLARTDVASGHRDEARDALGAIAKAGKLSAKAHLAMGELALAEGDRETAKKELAAASEDAHDPAGPLALGRLLLSEGQLTAALAPLTQAQERARLSAEPHLLLARAQVNLGQFDAAKPHLMAYLRERREDPQATALLARVALSRNDLAEARRLSDSAKDRAPSSAEVYWTHAQVALAAGDGGLVMRELDKRAKSSKTADAWCDLGQALLDLDDPKDAALAFGKAEKADRGSARARVGQALADAARGKTRALEGEDVAKLPPVLAARVLAAQSRAASGEQAKTLSAKAVALAEGAAEAQLARAAALNNKGEEAVAALRKAVAQEPALAEAHAALAEALVASGDSQRGLAEAEVARRIAPRGPSADRAKRLLSGGGEGKRRGK